MFLISEEIGKTVLSNDGDHLGRLSDLTLRLGADQPTVYRLVIGKRGRPDRLVPWSSVASIGPTAIRLTSDATVTKLTDTAHLEADELLLRRDVLDTQIFDANRHRMTRVSDILLELDEGGGLNVAAVDVGIGAVFRRMGMGRLGSRLDEQAVAWRDLHLTSDRGHAIQLATATAVVHRLGSRDLADLLTELNVERAHDVIRRVDANRAANAVALTHPDVRAQLLPVIPGGPAQPMSQAVPARTRRFLRLAGWRRNRPFSPAPSQDDGSDGLEH